MIIIVTTMQFMSFHQIGFFQKKILGIKSIVYSKITQISKFLNKKSLKYI